MTPHQAVIQAAALACLGTPWSYQGRQPGVAMDCVGLLEHCREAAGWPSPEVPRYAWPPASKLLLARLERHLVRVDRVPRPGDVCAFWQDKPGRVRHTGIAIRDEQGAGEVMASIGFGRVRREALPGVWLRRLHGVWEIPEPHDIQHQDAKPAAAQG